MTPSLPEIMTALLQARDEHVQAIAAIDAELEAARNALDDAWPRSRKKPPVTEPPPVVDTGWGLRAVRPLLRPPLPPMKRRQRLLAVLRELGVASVKVIRAQLGGHDKTVFNDLYALEQRGIVEKTLAGWRLTAPPTEVVNS